MEKQREAEPQTYRVRGSKQRISEAEFADRIHWKEKEEKEVEERRKQYLQSLPPPARFLKFGKNVIQKPDNNFLAFVALIFTLATFLIVVSRQVIQTNIK